MWRSRIRRGGDVIAGALQLGCFDFAGNPTVLAAVVDLVPGVITIVPGHRVGIASVGCADGRLIVGAGAAADVDLTVKVQLARATIG